MSPDSGAPTPERPSTRRQIGTALLLLATVATISAFGALSNIPNVDGWYAEVEKVPWNPPNGVFGPAWTALYAVIAFVGWLIWRAGYVGPGSPNSARGTLRLYSVQLALNALWSPLFFAGTPLIGKAAWWIAMADITLLLICVIRLIIDSRKRSRTAAILLVPYAAWLLFAATLNAGIIVLN